MRVICVDDERPALHNFKLTVEAFTDIEDLQLFSRGEEAIEWIKSNRVDVAFLDMEMPSIAGLELAKCLKEVDRNVRVVFVTAFDQYALEAFKVGAIGYVMKPYMRSEIRNELDKAKLIKDVQSKRVKISTIPNFSVIVDEKPFYIGREKPLELLALLVDRGEAGVSAGECVAILWPDKPNDTSTQSLFRVTYKRLLDALDQVGVKDILVSKNNRRYLRTDMVECDLYKILSGDFSDAKKYDGHYMDEYSWAEITNGSLHRMLLSEKYWE